MRRKKYLRPPATLDTPSEQPQSPLASSFEAQGCNREAVIVTKNKQNHDLIIK